MYFVPRYYNTTAEQLQAQIVVYFTPKDGIRELGANELVSIPRNRKTGHTRAAMHGIDPSPTGQSESPDEDTSG